MHVYATKAMVIYFVKEKISYNNPHLLMLEYLYLMLY